MRTVALEEHFWTPALAEVAGMELVAPLGGSLDDRLRDLGAGRLAAMDAAGIDMQVVSHTGPGAQHLGPEDGPRLAAQANDVLAAAVRAHPDRLAGFATLPTADPTTAANELRRCVDELGLVGAMVNSTHGTNGRPLDDPQFDPLLASAESSGVVLYLHPAAPPAAVRRELYGGFSAVVTSVLSTTAWGWHAETGLQVLRLVLGGVFERHPGLHVVVGHGGEMLPFMLDRLDTMLTRRVTGLPRLPSEYLLSNVWITTSGLFTLPPVLCALQTFGVDRLLYSVDYPFGSNAAGRALLDALPLDPVDLAKVAGGNADALLGLRRSPDGETRAATR